MLCPITLLQTKPFLGLGKRFLLTNHVKIKHTTTTTTTTTYTTTNTYTTNLLILILSPLPPLVKSTTIIMAIIGK